MSQAGIISTISGPVPPDVPTTFTADVGVATPAANNLNVFGQTNFVDDDAGIRTEGIGDTLLIQLTNRITATTTTTDATLTTIISLALGATPGTYYIYGNAQAFNASTPAGGSYSYGGAVRTDGATATLISAAYHDEFEEPALAAADIFLNVSGNNALLQVQGDALLSINWNTLLEYRMVT